MTQYKVTVYIIGEPYYHICNLQNTYNIITLPNALYEIVKSINTIHVTEKDIEMCIKELLNKGTASLGGSDKKLYSFIDIKEVP